MRAPAPAAPPRGLAALLLDLDGTLADTIALIVHCFARVLAPATGRPWSREEVIALFGPTEPVILARCGLADAFPAFLACYEEEHPRLARPFPGVAEVLAAARAAGVRLAVITNKGRATTAVTLRACGWEGRFAAVVTGDDVPAPKPHPAGIRLALDRLGVAPAAAAYVGDAPSDVEAARRAGVRAWGAAWGRVHPREELLAAGPDLVLERPADLARLLTGAAGTPAAPGDARPRDR